MTFCMQHMRATEPSQDAQMTQQWSAECHQASYASFFSFSQDSLFSLLSILLVVQNTILLRTLSALLPLL